MKHGNLKRGIFVFILLVAAAFSQSQEKPALATIQGQAVDTLTGAPVAGAAIRILPDNPDYASISDRNGRFVFKNIPAGNHRIVGAKQGYLEDTKGLDIDTAADTSPEPIQYRMAPAAVIIGRVIDDEGRPMRGARVQALEDDDQGGERKMLPRGNSSVTNDRGEFRLFWLDPGTYHVVVSMPPPTRPAIGYLPSNPEAGFVTTYYPGTADVNEAEWVRAGSGETDVHAIQMAVLPARTIRGRIPEAPGNALLASVQLTPLKDLPYNPSSQFNNVGLSASGQFEIRAGLMPGSYKLVVNLISPDSRYEGSATVMLEGDEDVYIEVPIQKKK